MRVVNVASWIALGSLSLALLACGSSSQSASGNNAASNGKQPAVSSASSASGPALGTAQSPTPVATPISSADASSADAWCAAAAQTQIVASPKHSAAFAQLCTSGKATAFFTTTLISSAYTGSGTPTLTPISPVADAGGIVSEYFGTALKLPVSSDTYYTNAAPKQGSVAVQTNLITQQGGTPGNVTVVPDQSTDKGWTRGWTVELASTKTIVIVTVDTDYTYLADQYKFGPGLYMYTSTLTAAKSTVQDYEMIAAGLDINGAGYLVSVAQIAASDHGLSSVAESTVTQMAQAQVVSTYNAASN